MTEQDASALGKLLHRYQSLGWYSGIQDLVTIRLQGGFEAFTNRACEDWRHQYVIVTASMPDLKLASYTATAPTLQEAAEQIMRLMPTKIHKQ